MQPETVKTWTDLALSYGPLGMFILSMVILRLFGFIQLPKKVKEQVYDERRQPVNVTCPISPGFKDVKADIQELVRLVTRMLEKQERTNTQLENLVRIHERNGTGTHKRVTLEDLDV